MTFAEFQASKTSLIELRPWLTDEDFLDGQEGHIYLDHLYIMDTTSWPVSAPGKGMGRWYTHIENNEYQSDDLAAIERPLYAFAQQNGYFDDPAEVSDPFVHPGRLFEVLTEAGLDSDIYHGFDDEVMGLFDDLIDIDPESVCGQACRAVIEAAGPLLAAIDPLARPAVWQGVLEACTILYRG